MEIPVYELNGIEPDDIGALFRRKKATTTAVKSAVVTPIKQGAIKKLSKVSTVIEAKKGGGVIRNIFNKVKKVNSRLVKNDFNKFASEVEDLAKRAEIVAKHLKTMQGLQGIYNKYLMPVSQGFANKKQQRAFKKARVLLSLEGVDYDAYRLASIYMPYVADIDENDGGYIFENPNVAAVAAIGEREFYQYADSPEATELGKLKLFKKIKNAVKKAAKKVAGAVKKVAKATANVVKKTVVQPVKAVAKATAKVTKAAVKSAANAVKATANVVKATGQLVTGKAKKAAATLKKAAKQVKNSVVQPVKATAQATKSVVKATAKATKAAVKTAVNAVKKTIKVAGKVLKVIFIKINPVTVLMRQSLRMLVALNFFGMATRLNVANMTEANAIKAGYTKQQYADAVKAKKRVVKFFTKMGGKAKNIEKAIVNGSKKKALFKKDIKSSTKIKSKGDDNATLGDPGTIGAALAAVGAFFAKIWGWIKNIVPKIGKAVKKAANKVGNAAKKVADTAKKVANKATNTVQKATGLLKKNDQQTQDTVMPMDDTTQQKKFPWWILAVAAAGVATVVVISKKK